MILLERKFAPNAIEANGRDFLLETDYRPWLTFPERIKSLSEGNSDDYKELFLEDAPFPTDEVLNQLKMFYFQKPAVPRTDSAEKVLDYRIDADYIYAAFMQAYGIDLVDEDLHWHKFSALLKALPGNTVLSRIIEHRTYKGKDKEMNKLKHEWALPVECSEEELQAMEEFDALFG